MIVVSDTSPICYLLLIREVDILPKLYQKVLIPTTVEQELAHPKSPQLIQAWIQDQPQWLTVQAIATSPRENLDMLDPGESDAILLAEKEEADLVIIDDLAGRQVAKSRGLNVTGLLGVLDEAAQCNLVDFPSVISRLQQTTFRTSSALVQSLLDKY